ncbi:MAG: diguanylate phosphodiesterase [Betaproteobacteria bacterium RBG_16_58_11]|nr:MAG: diguanylate phosphodiesterase [Betaproteobacteria bacterium RBG_16_58_11]
MPNGDIFLGRQPILDRKQSIVAYELLFRSGQANQAVIQDELNATANVIVSLFNEMGVQSVLGKEIGFINVNAEMLMSDMLQLLPNDRVVIELLETIEITPRILDQCRQLKRAGFSLALDDFAIMHEQYRELLPMVDVIKVDLMQVPNDALTSTALNLRKYPAKLLAEKVETHEQFEQCLKLGFHFFQGYYFAKPVILTGKRAEPSKLTLFKLLGLILDDAASGRLESAVKEDSNLTYNLLRLVNSVGAGIGQKIDSLSKAIMVVGRRQLQRWLQLLLYTINDKGQTSNPLLQLAATRGKMLEILCRCVNNQDTAQQERAFMTGTFSLLDTLLSMPMVDIMAELSLADDVKQALIERSGRLGLMLKLIEVLEAGDFDATAQLLQQLPELTPAMLNEAQMAAIRWVSSLSETK